MNYRLSARSVLRPAFGAAACLALAGCNPEGERPDVGNGGTAATPFIPPELPVDGLSQGGNGNDQCVATKSEAQLVKDPVDIILLVDNSESMINELDAVERNININFAQILEEGGVDYRLVLISSHRNRVREGSTGIGSDIIPDTGICVEAPLSGVETCPAPAPVPSQHFYQYNHAVGSGDSLQLILDTYKMDPDKPCGQNPPPCRPPIDLNPANPQEGWSTWLRPGVSKVFLEMTDDDSTRMDATAFLGNFSEIAPEMFNGNYERPKFVFHSIVGLAERGNAGAYEPSEPLVTGTCASADTPGTVYQELSVASGGLRFPLCEFDAYDAVFSEIADDVVRQAPVACEFDIPTAPSGQAVTLDNVAVSFTPGSGGAARELAQVRTAASCKEDTFYVENNQISLCPTPCARVRSDLDAAVDVLFTCRNTLIE
jgi:hypothetical protein